MYIPTRNASGPSQIANFKIRLKCHFPRIWLFQGGNYYCQPSFLNNYIPKYIIFNNFLRDSIEICFCTKQLWLESCNIRQDKNAVVICNKQAIFAGDIYNYFGNNAGSFFLDEEVIGIGIVQFPYIFTMKSFTSCNGNFLFKN